MAIRFLCKNCGQLLSIGTRKAGTEIHCPRCECAQAVPGPEAAEAAMAMAQVLGTRPMRVVGRAARGASPRAGRKTESGVLRGPAAFRSNGARWFPDGARSLSRAARWILGLLFLLVAMASFLAGYLVGHHAAPSGSDAAVADGAATVDRVLLEAKLIYAPEIGQSAGDESAVLIALPADRRPVETLSVYGLGPRTPVPPASHDSVQAIERCGGVYARADASGMAPLVFPSPGTYRVLLVSRHASRPSGEAIDPSDLEAMKKIFPYAAELIGASKYSWSMEDIRPGGSPIEHDFGLDGFEFGEP